MQLQVKYQKKKKKKKRKTYLEANKLQRKYWLTNLEIWK